MRLEEKLVLLRKQKRLSQMYVAEAMKVSRQAISHWEVGTALPSTENLRKLAELYGVSIDELLNDQMSLNPEQQMVEPQPLPKQEDASENKITSIKKSGYRPLYIVLTAVLVLLGIAAGYLIGQHQARDAVNEVIPIEELEVETWDDFDVDMYTYGWPDVWQGGEEE